MKIVFTGDLFTGGDLLYSKNAGGIDVHEFTHADLKICNLEQGSGDNECLLDKSTVTTPLRSLKFLKDNNINIVSLANNHIQDKNDVGFLQTLNHIKKLRIRYVGAGCNIHEAPKSIDLGDGFHLLSFCDFGKKYLHKVQVASSTDYGVNPLTFENIMKSISSLPSNAKAIVMVHWGRENVWLPPYSDLLLAKKVLEIDKVFCIIGSHSHHVQGALKHKGKYAYFSLGNFLFPNFFIMPRTQIFYPDKVPQKFNITKEYHPVFTLAHKRWKLVNRLSMILTLNTETECIKSTIVKQDYLLPVTNDVTKNMQTLVKFLFFLNSLLLRAPRVLYVPIEFIWRNILNFQRFFNLLLFYIFKEKKIFQIFTLRKSL